MREEAARGIPGGTLAFLSGINLSCVRRILYGDTWEHAGGPRQPRRALEPRPGKVDKRVKLQPKQVLAIREAFKAGALISRLAEDYGSDITNIMRIVRGVSWKNLVL